MRRSKGTIGAIAEKADEMASRAGRMIGNAAKSKAVKAAAGAAVALAATALVKSRGRTRPKAKRLRAGGKQKAMRVRSPAKPRTTRRAGRGR
jgi:hypothetical protein